MKSFSTTNTVATTATCAPATVLCSVYDKRQIIELASRLQHDHSASLLSSSGTRKLLQSATLDVTDIAEYTGSPEVLGGRVKTLHPAIHAGILNVRTNPDHQHDLRAHDWSNIDVVVVNLYPFESQNCIEHIDIGGVTLLRAAAKNYAHVLVVTDPNDYTDVLARFDVLTGTSKESVQMRKVYARKAFHHVVQYDIAIARYFEHDDNDDTPASSATAPDTLYQVYHKHPLTLKYGCNPHQRTAAVYRLPHQPFPFDVLHGTAGYINMLDANAAWLLVCEAARTLDTVCAASFKHCTPAGVGTCKPLSDVLFRAYMVPTTLQQRVRNSPVTVAYLRARNADPLSSFGDFVAVSDIVDDTLAEVLCREVSDGIVAPSYTDGALDKLSRKKKGKYIVLRATTTCPNAASLDVRTCASGMALVQTPNNAQTNASYLTNIVTTTDACTTLPADAARDLMLANITLKYTPSNSICYATDGQVVGVGAGQQNRVDCVRLAGEKARTWWLRQAPSTLEILADTTKTRTARTHAAFAHVKTIKNASSTAAAPDKLAAPPMLCMASDGFLPFADNIDVCASFGVQYVLQPGGSVRDSDVVDACASNGITMCMSGVRVFTH